MAVVGQAAAASAEVMLGDLCGSAAPAEHRLASLPVSPVSPMLGCVPRTPSNLLLAHSAQLGARPHGQVRAVGTAAAVGHTRRAWSHTHSSDHSMCPRVPSLPANRCGGPDVS